MTYQLIAASKVPARALGATAKERLAAYQAKRAAERAAQAAALAPSILAGKALTDGVTYATSAEATKAAANAKRLVAAALKAAGFRGSVAVTGEGAAFSWYLTAVAVAAE
jgi:creatinine amidohydrolase/Fe(II)-dependent formamide hydrolase-like protein